MPIKFFERMDGLPIVKLLQLSAVIIFLADTIHLLTAGQKVFIHSLDINIYSIFDFLMTVLMVLSRTLYQPMILLGIAKIIQIKEKQKLVNQQEAI